MSDLENWIADTGGASGSAQSVPQDFVERVKQAVQNMEAEGITLWRPGVSEKIQELFDVVISGPSEGCTNEQCGHNSHDPASPYIKPILYIA